MGRECTITDIIRRRALERHVFICGGQCPPHIVIYNIYTYIQKKQCFFNREVRPVAMVRHLEPHMTGQQTRTRIVITI